MAFWGRFSVAPRLFKEKKPMNLKEHIRSIPDFPKPGILFYDIGTLLAHGPAWQETVRRLTEEAGKMKPDRLVGIESRGFLMAAPVAEKLGIGFAMARKKGKLPGKTLSCEYDLEYGSAVLEIQEGMIKKGERVVILDDLLATGGTAAATVELAQKAGAEVAGSVFVIELSFLEGRKRLEKLKVPSVSLLSYSE
jgi:adenine phosphoribosyltransferase